MILLAVEATGILVEIMAFTMMGIIVNAGSTLRYVSMALLVLVYMHDCYSKTVLSIFVIFFLIFLILRVFCFLFINGDSSSTICSL
jgi:hypothetical protein